jgi:AcrR family transcriptional regulator
MARADARQKVLTAARAVFAREGYRSATVAHILVEAGIARGTFYRYFPNKREVFYEIISDMFKTLYDASREVLGGEELAVESRVRESLELSYRLFLENRGVIVVYFRQAFRADPGFYALWENFEKRMIALFSSVLERGMKEGVFRNVDTGLISRAIFQVFMQVPYWDILLGGISEIDVGAMADEMIGFVLRGIAATRPPGAAGRRDAPQ